MQLNRGTLPQDCQACCPSKTWFWTVLGAQAQVWGGLMQDGWFGQRRRNITCHPSGLEFILSKMTGLKQIISTFYELMTNRKNLWYLVKNEFSCLKDKGIGQCWFTKKSQKITRLKNNVIFTDLSKISCCCEDCCFVNTECRSFWKQPLIILLFNNPPQHTHTPST